MDEEPRPAPDEEWRSWIEMETIRDPPNPWLVTMFAWSMLLAALTIALLIKGSL